MFTDEDVNGAVDGQMDELIDRARAKRLSAETAPPPAVQQPASTDPNQEDEEYMALQSMLGPNPLPRGST